MPVNRVVQRALSVAIAFAASAVVGQTKPDGLAELSKANPTVKRQLEKEKRRDDSVSAIHDALTGPAGPSGSVQRSQKDIISQSMSQAGINSTQKANDQAKKKMYDERAKQLMLEEYSRQDRADKAEMRKALEEKDRENRKGNLYKNKADNQRGHPANYPSSKQSTPGTSF